MNEELCISEEKKIMKASGKMSLSVIHQRTARNLMSKTPASRQLCHEWADSGPTVVHWPFAIKEATLILPKAHAHSRVFLCSYGFYNFSGSLK